MRIVEFALTVLGELYKGLRRAGYIICCIVATPIVIVLAALFITALALFLIYRTIRGDHLVFADDIREQILGDQFQRRSEFDPAVNRAHLSVRLPDDEIPEPPEVNLDALKQFYPDIDLTQFVENVKNGCAGLVLAPTDPEEAEVFKERLIKMAKHVLYQFQHGDHEDDAQRAICENFLDVGRACATRHEEDLKLAYQRLTGKVQIMSTQQKVIRLMQRLRLEILDRLVAQSGGGVHMQTAILQAIGGEFQIPGYETANDRGAGIVDILDLRHRFHALYTADALVERFSVAVNRPSALREIPRQELINWCKKNTPAGYQPDLETDARWRTYLTEEVYTEDMNGIKPEALRTILIQMRILSEPLPEQEAPEID